MEPLDFNNPYGDKLVRKKNHRKNKVSEKGDNEVNINVTNNSNNIFSGESTNKIGFHDEEDYIMDMMYLNRKSSETKSKEAANDLNDKLPVLPKPVQIENIPKPNKSENKKASEKIPDENKTKKEGVSKVTIILSVIIGVLVILVIVLLVLTIGNFFLINFDSKILKKLISRI